MTLTAIWRACRTPTGPGHLRGRPGMPDGVGEGLLHHPEDGQLLGRGHRRQRHRRTRGDTRQTGAAGPLHQRAQLVARPVATSAGGLGTGRAVPAQYPDACGACRATLPARWWRWYASASPAWSGSVAMAYAPPSACTIMTARLCATTSCSSRAIAARSSATASCARWSRSRSAVAARSSTLAHVRHAGSAACIRSATPPC